MDDPPVEGVGGPVQDEAPGEGAGGEVEARGKSAGAASGESPRPRFDRWAHRRGEPRVFAFLWTIYLVGATGLALASVGARGQVPIEVYRPVAQVLLVTVSAGVVIVWPL